jgi:uncharacterized low-complexity protein
LYGFFVIPIPGLKLHYNEEFYIMNTSKTAITMALTAALGSTGVAFANDNPFGMQVLDQGYQQLADSHTKAKDGKCGEGKCGAGMKTDADKATDGKCGEGKCGAAAKDATKAKDGKCGEGKCGAGMEKKPEATDPQ